MFKSKIITILAIGVFIFGCTSSSVKSPTPMEPVVVPLPMPIPTIANPSSEGLLGSGNKNLGRVDVGVGDTANVEIDGHSYRTIYFEDELKKLSEISTYVILPKNLSESTNVESKIYKRYKRTLELIQHLDKVEVENDGTLSSFYEDENIFVLFSNVKEKPVSPRNYNYALSNKVLKFFRKKYAHSLFREDGPYLITTIKNVWDEKEDFSFLYVNLSKFNKSAVDEIIGSYKERLIKSGIDEITTFEKWHASLLAFVTNFSSDIHIFQTAVAGGFGD